MLKILALGDVRPGVSYVDDCSWVISFNSQAEFKRKATELLDEVPTLTTHRFKTEVGWIFASERPGARIKKQALDWNLRWRGITRRSVVYFKRIKKRTDDKCWFCNGPARTSRSHILLHYPNARLAAARTGAWEGRGPRSIRVLLSNPRSGKRFLKFLELSGVGEGRWPIGRMLRRHGRRRWMPG